MPTQLQRNLEDIRTRIQRAQARGDHAAAEVRLVVVTKSVSPDLFPALAAAGVTDIGENRVQQAAQRRPLSPPGWTWHGIGHLQRNKAKEAVELFDTFHALDSERLANRLESVLAGAKSPWPVYIEVNAADDPAKHGVVPEEVVSFVKALARHSHLVCRGFMTMARLDADEADARRTFSVLREVRDEAVQLGVGAEAPTGLSMGMTDDYEWAIEEGATLVRVGRAVFEGIEPGEALS